MSIHEIDGYEWVVESFSDEDVQVVKENELLAEWVKGNYYIRGKSISEQDLAIVVRLVEEFKNNVSK